MRGVERIIQAKNGQREDSCVLLAVWHARVLTIVHDVCSKLVSLALVDLPSPPPGTPSGRRSKHWLYGWTVNVAELAQHLQPKYGSQILIQPPVSQSSDVQLIPPKSLYDEDVDSDSSSSWDGSQSGDDSHDEETSSEADKVCDDDLEGLIHMLADDVHPGLSDHLHVVRNSIVWVTRNYRTYDGPRYERALWKVPDASVLSQFAQQANLSAPEWIPLQLLPIT